jgi:hypothetical protein
VSVQSVNLKSAALTCPGSKNFGWNMSKTVGVKAQLNFDDIIDDRRRAIALCGLPGQHMGQERTLSFGLDWLPCIGLLVTDSFG